MMLLQYFILKKILSELKETKRRVRETAKGVLGNLSPYLTGTSASLFLSLTSLTFNRRSQFAGRETPRWQEMKPPRHTPTPQHRPSPLLQPILYSSLCNLQTHERPGIETRRLTWTPLCLPTLHFVPQLHFILFLLFLCLYANSRV